jgi:hypothetical protein
LFQEEDMSIYLQRREYQSERIPLLDSGYMEYVEHWGMDERVIEAARMSVGRGFVSWEPYAKHPRGDFGLLDYLHKNQTWNTIRDGGYDTCDPESNHGFP